MMEKPCPRIFQRNAPHSQHSGISVVCEPAYHTTACTRTSRSGCYRNSLPITTKSNEFAAPASDGTSRCANIGQSSFFGFGISSDMTLAAFAAIFSIPSASAALSCYSEERVSKTWGASALRNVTQRAPKKHSPWAGPTCHTELLYLLYCVSAGIPLTLGSCFMRPIRESTMASSVSARF